ncbi:hypothetical protein, partial [Ursidibacter arcticus]|uniref:hypothetical protein n=1 Tax=Ursidibacter arcticus TaxID=1524965 RepID=UPI001966D11E
KHNRFFYKPVSKHSGTPQFTVMLGGKIIRFYFTNLQLSKIQGTPRWRPLIGYNKLEFVISLYSGLKPTIS